MQSEEEKLSAIDYVYSCFQNQDDKRRVDYTIQWKTLDCNLSSITET